MRPPERQIPRLEVTDALGRRVVRMTQSVLLLGRSPDCDLKLAGSEVSRRHARIVPERDAYVIEDLGSRYGTFVNGERASGHVLVHGDRIRLGRSGGAEIVFSLDRDGTDTLSKGSDIARA